MVEFKTLKSKEIKFGKNSFIEVSKRRVITPVSENDFIAISRGYYLPDKTKRWRSSIALPNEKDKREQIAKLIKSL
jgi:penicillin-binding protein-related factor A (putative recombinase)